MEALEEVAYTPKEAADNAKQEEKNSPRPIGRSAWIRYRIEHRDKLTDRLISHRDIDGTDSGGEVDDFGKVEEGSTPPVFSFVTTHKHSLDGSQSGPQSEPLPLPMNRSTLSAGDPPSFAIHLHSPAIIQALRKVVKYYPSQNLTGTRIIINWPYPVLVHHYHELGELRNEISQKVEEDLCEKERGACDHIDLLLDFLNQNIMHKVKEERELNTQGFYTFEYCWVGNKPGQTVLERLKGGPNKHNRYQGVVHSLSGGVFTYPWSKWVVKKWHLEYNGQYLGRVSQTTEVEKFDGKRRMFSYRVEDLERRPLPEEVSNQLDYGKMYWKLLKKQWKYYKGRTQRFPFNEVDGLVMTDLKTFFAEEQDEPSLMDTKDCSDWNTNCQCRVCRRRLEEAGQDKEMGALFENYSYIDPEIAETLTEHQYFLCQFEIYAFVFRTRTWELLHTGQFSEPLFDETQINNLVMDERRKLTLKGLAKSFARVTKRNGQLSRPPWTADFVEGKGHGLIFLLHGRPGVGKTCTAECIASFTRRPLMVLTSSDIGTNVRDVEVNLTRKFKMAKSWDVVLLLDEADVFLERRSNTDLARNGLVAGFLRALELFDGILFLTTNRVGTFDDALLSRVHVKLYYPEFNDEQRQQIWKTFMDKLIKDRGDYMRLNIDAKDYIRGKDIQALRLNGREIRNAFQTAVSLAEFDSDKDEDGRIVVTDEHLRTVMTLSKDFKSYFDELHEGDEAKRAERKYERLDTYSHGDDAK
ncbi:P-loop containing nucleoside triphosphate hydrolase protein [Xylariaceae sp. FL1272]|nr:P-loop containing nucleoside triphosphate hydrolase protein [Xylariaceae sp. FL1272]